MGLDIEQQMLKEFESQCIPSLSLMFVQSTPLVLTSDKAIFFYNDVFFRNGNEPLYISIKILRLTRLRYIQISLVTMQFSIPEQKFYSVSVMLPPRRYKSCPMSDNSVECTNTRVPWQCVWSGGSLPREGSSECAQVVLVVFGDSTQRDGTGSYYGGRRKLASLWSTVHQVSVPYSWATPLPPKKIPIYLVCF